MRKVSPFGTTTLLSRCRRTASMTLVSSMSSQLYGPISFLMARDACVDFPTSETSSSVHAVRRVGGHVSATGDGAEPSSLKRLEHKRRAGEQCMPLPPRDAAAPGRADWPRRADPTADVMTDIMAWQRRLRTGRLWRGISKQAASTCQCRDRPTSLSPSLSSSLSLQRGVSKQAASTCPSNA